MAHPSTFYPWRTKTPTQKRAYKCTHEPKRAQIPSKSSFFSIPLISWGSLFALLPRDGSNPISSSTPPPLPAPSFHLLYRDSNSGLIEGFVRWGIASYPGTFCGPHDTSHLLLYFSYSLFILYQVKTLLTKMEKKIIEDSQLVLHRSDISFVKIKCDIVINNKSLICNILLICNNLLTYK